MQVIIQLPDEIAKHLGDAGHMPRRMLEAFAAEAYRTQKLSRHQLRQLLALDYWQTDAFISQHEANRPYTMADLQIDRDSLATLPQK